MGRAENKGAVDGLFMCPMLGYRVTVDECDRFLTRDVGCPTDCAARVKQMAKAVPDAPAEEIPPNPPLAKGGEGETGLAKGGDGEAGLAKGGEGETGLSKGSDGEAAADQTTPAKEKAICLDIGGPGRAAVFVWPGDPEKGQKKYALYDEGGGCLGRYCSACGEPKPWRMFFRAKSGPMGRMPHCIDCDYKKKRIRREKKSAQAETSTPPTPPTPPQPSPPKAERETASADELKPGEIMTLPGEILEAEFPSSDEILDAIERGAYQAAADAVAGAFERIAANIRKGASK